MDAATNTKTKGLTPFRWYTLSRRRSKSILSINKESAGSPDFNVPRTSVQRQFQDLQDENRPIAASAADRPFISLTFSTRRRPVQLSGPPTAPSIHQPLSTKRSMMPFPHLPTISQTEGETADEDQKNEKLSSTIGEIEIERQLAVKQLNDITHNFNSLALEEGSLQTGNFGGPMKNISEPPGGERSRDIPFMQAEQERCGWIEIQKQKAHVRQEKDKQAALSHQQREAELLRQFKAARGDLRLAELTREEENKCLLEERAALLKNLAAATKSLEHANEEAIRYRQEAAFAMNYLQTLIQQRDAAETAKRESIDREAGGARKLYTVLQQIQTIETEKREIVHRFQEKETSLNRQLTITLEEKRRLEERVKFEQEQLKSERQRSIQLENRLQIERSQRMALEKQADGRQHKLQCKNNELAKKRHEVQNTVGCPVTARRVNLWGTIIDEDLNKLTPAMLGQTKNVKDAVSKNFQIKSIEYIMNDKLYQQFDETRSRFKKLGRGAKEVLLFHGTNQQNITA